MEWNGVGVEIAGARDEQIEFLSASFPSPFVLLLLLPLLCCR